MKRAALILSMIMMLSLAAAAQDYAGKGRVQGVVTDEQGKPIEGVKVKLFFTKTETGFETATDAQGIWKASWIKGGTWYIDFDKVGYGPKKISASILDSGKNPPIETRMKKIEGLILTDELKKLLGDGNMLYEQKKYDEAIAAFSQILQKYPDAYVIHLNVGNCYFQQEKYAEAEAEFMKILEKEEKNVNALMGVANSYANRGENAKALEWYRKIEFEKLDDTTVLYNIGVYLLKAGQYEEAEKFFKKSVDLDPNNLDGIFQLGIAYTSQLKKDEAVAMFENYLKLDSDSQRAGQVKGFIDYLRKK